MWAGRFDGPLREWTWRVQEDGVSLANLRKFWPTFMKVARGEADKSSLPRWTTHSDEPPDEDDDIPF